MTGALKMYTCLRASRENVNKYHRRTEIGYKERQRGDKRLHYRKREKKIIYTFENKMRKCEYIRKGRQEDYRETE